MRYIDRERPDSATLAWPRSALSSMQNLNMKSEEASKKVAQRQSEDEAFVQFALQAIRRQLKYGQRIFIENPVIARAWKLSPGRELMWLLDPAKLHMCAYGLRDPRSGAFLQTPTFRSHFGSRPFCLEAAGARRARVRPSSA